MRLVGIALALMVATPSQAMTYFLSEDLGVSGFQHYCQYSDGNTYSFRSTQLCPMSINVDGITTSGVTGFKQGEYQDGMTKVCVYSVLGNQRFLRVDGTDLCPLSYEF